MKPWLLLSLATLLIWGGWGIFANLTARYMRTYSAVFWEVVGAAAVAIIVLIFFLRVTDLETNARGVTFGVLTGITYTVGLVFLFFALRSGVGEAAVGPGGRVHTILVITAMYPLVAAALNYTILSEPISGRQLLGMFMGVGAIAVFVSGGD
jgi:drug/metabolite transporter (DMT)-like permease